MYIYIYIVTDICTHLDIDVWVGVGIYTCMH